MENSIIDHVSDEYLPYPDLMREVNNLDRADRFVADLNLLLNRASGGAKFTLDRDTFTRVFAAVIGLNGDDPIPAAKLWQDTNLWLSDGLETLKPGCDQAKNSRGQLVVMKRISRFLLKNPKPKREFSNLEA